MGIMRASHSHCSYLHHCPTVLLCRAFPQCSVHPSRQLILDTHRQQARALLTQLPDLHLPQRLIRVSHLLSLLAAPMYLSKQVQCEHMALAVLRWKAVWKKI